MQEPSTKAASNLSGSPIKLAVFKDHAKDQLMELLDSVQGTKTLVIDPALSGQIGMVADGKSLKDHGVERMVYLEQGKFSTEQQNIIYLVSPRVANMHIIAEHFHYINSQSTSRGNRNFYIYFVSRKTMICERVLENAGLLTHSNRVRIAEFQLDLIPFDDDVLSLELDDCFKEYFLDHNPASLYYVARSLMKIQSIFGVIGNIKGKGTASRMVADMVLRMRRELDIEEEAKVPEIDSLILIDRDVDMITPMCTPYTYEALVDDVFSIKYGAVQVDGALLLKEAGSLQRQTVNSTDSIFNNMRNLNIDVLRPYISKRAATLKEYKDKRHEQQTIGEIREYVKHMATFQAERQSLAIHTNIAQAIAKERNKPAFRKKLEVEGDVVSGCGTAFKYIEECINKKEPIVNILKLLILQSLTSGGLKSKSFHFFRRELLHTYGNEYFIALSSLEQLGLVTLHEGKTTYPALRKSLRLINPEVNLAEPDDIGFVFHGFVPLSVRIVEATKSQQEWNNIQDSLRLLPGTQFEETQEIPEGIKQLSQDRMQGRRNTVTLVFYIGGITYSEIAAIRYLHALENGTRDFIIATTSFINGRTLLETFVMPASAPAIPPRR